MTELQACTDTSRNMTTTSYCWPVVDYEQLRIAAGNLKTQRCNPKDWEHGENTFGLAELVDEHLRRSLSASSITFTDDTGHTVMFVGLIPPLPQARIKHLSKFDEEPLLLAVLLPELAFNLSEAAATYCFSIQDSLMEQYGTSDISPYIITHRGTLYTTFDATFQILLREYPSLLVPLGFSFLFRGDRQPVQIHEILKDSIESLRLVETRLTDGAFEVISLETPQVFVEACLTCLTHCQASMAHILIPESEEHISVRHTLYEAIYMLLEDEKLVLQSFELPTPVQDDPMEVDIEASQEPIIDFLHVIFRNLRRVRRTLHILRQCIPTD